MSTDDRRMAVAALALEEASRRGVTLQGTPAGKLRWRCHGQVPDLLRRLILEHKPELLALLRVNAWDQAAADALVNTALARRREIFGPTDWPEDPAAACRLRPLVGTIDDAWTARDLTGLRVAVATFLEAIEKYLRGPSRENLTVCKKNVATTATGDTPGL
jgi:hypothetical protein